MTVTKKSDKIKKSAKTKEKKVSSKEKKVKKVKKVASESKVKKKVGEKKASKKAREIQFNYQDAEYKHFAMNSPATVIIKVEGEPKLFISAQAAYLYLCTEDEELKSKLENCLDVKRIGYYMSSRSGYKEPSEKRRLRAASAVAKAKFIEGHPFFRKLLMSTEGQTLISHQFWEKEYSFWGINKSGEGDNHWGKLLMEIRDAYIEKKRG